jgi:hypothetical protein
MRFGHPVAKATLAGQMRWEKRQVTDGLMNDSWAVLKTVTVGSVLRSGLLVLDYADGGGE